MDITIKLDTNNIEDIKQLIGLCNQLISDGGEIEEVLIQPTTPDITQEDSPQLSIGEVQAKLIAIAKVVGTEKIKSLLKDYGVEKISDLEPIKYGELIKSAEELK